MVIITGSPLACFFGCQALHEATTPGRTALLAKGPAVAEAPRTVAGPVELAAEALSLPRAPTRTDCPSARASRCLLSVAMRSPTWRSAPRDTPCTPSQLGATCSVASRVRTAWRLAPCVENEQESHGVRAHSVLSQRKGVSSNFWLQETNLRNAEALSTRRGPLFRRVRRTAIGPS